MIYHMEPDNYFFLTAMSSKVFLKKDVVLMVKQKSHTQLEKFMKANLLTKCLMVKALVNLLMAQFIVVNGVKV